MNVLQDRVKTEELVLMASTRTLAIARLDMQGKIVKQVIFLSFKMQIMFTQCDT